MFGEGNHNNTKLMSKYAPDLARHRFYVELNNWHWVPMVVLGAILLVDMRLMWYEASALLLLFLISFADVGGGLKIYVMWIYFGWSVFEIVRLILGNRGNSGPNALHHLRTVLAGSRS